MVYDGDDLKVENWALEISKCSNETGKEIIGCENLYPKNFH